MLAVLSVMPFVQAATSLKPGVILNPVLTNQQERLAIIDT